MKYDIVLQTMSNCKNCSRTVYSICRATSIARKSKILKLCIFHFHTADQEFIYRTGDHELKQESVEWFIEDQACSPSYDSAPCRPPPPPPPTFPVSIRLSGDTQDDWEREVICWKGGRGLGRSQITRQQESLVLYKSFNTLWLKPSKMTFFYSLSHTIVMWTVVIE